MKPELIVIHEPIWDGGRRKLGVAKYKIKGEFTYLKTDYLNAKGELVYPYIYKIESKKALKYPTQKLRGGVVVHKIPIEDLTEIKYIGKPLDIPEELPKKPEQIKLSL
jgi:hypothetical protein